MAIQNSIKGRGTGGEKIVITRLRETESHDEMYHFEFLNVFGHWQSLYIDADDFEAMLLFVMPTGARVPLTSNSDTI